MAFIFGAKIVRPNPPSREEEEDISLNLSDNEETIYLLNEEEQSLQNELERIRIELHAAQLELAQTNPELAKQLQLEGLLTGKTERQLPRLRRSHPREKHGMSLKIQLETD